MYSLVNGFFPNIKLKLNHASFPTTTEPSLNCEKDLKVACLVKTYRT